MLPSVAAFESFPCGDVDLKWPNISAKIYITKLGI